MLDMIYGSEHIHYGAGECPACHQKHASPYVIKESSKSRFKLMQFAAEMTAYDTHGQTRLAVADAFLKARAGSDLSKLNKNIKQTQKEIDNPKKATAIDLNRAKLEKLESQYAQKDKELTDPLRNIRTAFETRFPGAQQGYSPSYAASLRGADVKFMLGILLSGDDVLVTTSGSGLDTEPFTAAAALKGYTVCEGVNVADPHQSIIARPIPTVQYGNTQREQGYAPGSCAAPRLLAKAFTIPRIFNNLKNWEMSEIYYFPNNEARRAHEDESDKARVKHVEEAHKGERGDHPNCVVCQQLNAATVGSLYWVPGLSAHSCNTCEQLVPLLMCPNVA
jgi:hypothetical protein